MPSIRWLIHDFMITHRLFGFFSLSFFISILMCQQRPQFGECNVILFSQAETTIGLFVSPHKHTHIENGFENICAVFSITFELMVSDDDAAASILFMVVFCFIFGIERIPLNGIFFGLLNRSVSVEKLCVTLFETFFHFISLPFNKSILISSLSAHHTNGPMGLRCDVDRNGKTKTPFLAKSKFTFFVPFACLEY